jgi:hypothetical protein
VLAASEPVLDHSGFLFSDLRARRLERFPFLFAADAVPQPPHVSELPERAERPSLFHAPTAFGIITDRTRAVVGEVYARATSLDAYENLLIGEQQLAAAQEGIQRSRSIVSAVIGWAPEDYEREDRAATRRAQFEIVSAQRANVTNVG